MTTKEFSDNFDTLLNSYSGGQDITLDEYEKSEFLTQAQEQLVVSYYSGKNSLLESFESTEEIRRYLNSLVKTAELEPVSITSRAILADPDRLYDREVTLPSDLWFITYETAKISSIYEMGCASGKELPIVPISQDTFHRAVENPFKGVGLRRAFRLEIGNGKVELVSKYFIDKYIVRYVSRPAPIILIDLSEGLTINGSASAATCTLHSALHRPILELAVKLALQSKGIQLQQQQK